MTKSNNEFLITIVQNPKYSNIAGAGGITLKAYLQSDGNYIADIRALLHIDARDVAAKKHTL